jgi:hypothetical protein
MCPLNFYYVINNDINKDVIKLSCKEISIKTHGNKIVKVYNY